MHPYYSVLVDIMIRSRRANPNPLPKTKPYSTPHDDIRMSMNIFRLCGDMSRLFSILILFHHLRVAKNASGISLRTQELFLLLFLTRYTNLFTTYYSLYNSVMKILYIASTAGIVYTIRARYSSDDKSRDTFCHKFGILPCVALMILTQWITVWMG